MFSPQFMQALRCQSQFGRVRFSGQGYRSQYMTATRLDKASQIGKRTAHAYKIVHQYVIAPSLHRPVKSRLACQTPETIGSRVGDNIDLHDAFVGWPAKHLPQPIRKNLGDRIDTFSLQCVGTDQRRFDTTGDTLQRQRAFQVESIKHQSGCSIVIARLGCKVGRVLLDCRLTGMNQHIGKVTPRGARRLCGY